MAATTSLITPTLPVALVEDDTTTSTATVDGTGQSTTEASSGETVVVDDSVLPMQGYTLDPDVDISSLAIKYELTGGFIKVKLCASNFDTCDLILGCDCRMRC